jgi:hypothetical protein
MAKAISAPIGFDNPNRFLFVIELVNAMEHVSSGAGRTAASSQSDPRNRQLQIPVQKQLGPADQNSKEDASLDPRDQGSAVQFAAL